MRERKITRGRVNLILGLHEGPCQKVRGPWKDSSTCHWVGAGGSPGGKVARQARYRCSAASWSQSGFPSNLPCIFYFF